MNRYHIWLQQRHLTAIVGALRFRQQLIAGNLVGTFGKVAFESWNELPLIVKDPYPARVGNADDVRKEIDDACASLLRIVWKDNPLRVEFEDSPEGRLAARLLPQRRQMARHTRYKIIVAEKDLRELSWAVEFEMRMRIGHLDRMDDVLYVAMNDRLQNGDDMHMQRLAVKRILERIKLVAWEIDHCGNYGPWFSYKTKFLYDIYQVFQHEFGHWRYDTIFPILPNVPLMEIKSTH